MGGMTRDNCYPNIYSAFRYPRTQTFREELFKITIILLAFHYCQYSGIVRVSSLFNYCPLYCNLKQPFCGIVTLNYFTGGEGERINGLRFLSNWQRITLIRNTILHMNRSKAVSIYY